MCETKTAMLKPGWRYEVRLCHAGTNGEGDGYPDYDYELLCGNGSLPEFQWFIGKYGWTTNQFLNGLMYAVTNNLTDVNWQDEEKRHTAGVAAWKLGEIDNPAVTNFFRQFNDGDDTDRLKNETILPMFWCTNLEPEVLAIMPDVEYYIRVRNML